jgi:NAD(P)-dependent dehydrogenase (short-subunit alcohol dehydrogenase family)
MHPLARAPLALLLLLAACAMPGAREADRTITAGRTWVVTGASSGIGRGVAERAGALGANVGARGQARGGARGRGAHHPCLRRQALVVPTDVGDAQAMEALAEASERRFGRIDLWFNNAGPSRRSAASRRSRLRITPARSR